MAGLKASVPSDEVTRLKEVNEGLEVTIRELTKLLSSVVAENSLLWEQGLRASEARMEGRLKSQELQERLDKVTEELWEALL